MIFKSYILEQSFKSINNCKMFLFYGENQGLKKEFKEKLKIENKDGETLNLFQDEVIKNKNIIVNEITNKSLFNEKKMIFINETNDKILDIVDEVVENEGIVLSSNAAFIQGIFGIAGEKRGELALVSSSPSEELKADQITSGMKGKILIGGSFLSLEAYKKALSVNVAGMVVGGFNYYDLKAILGYNLGVAITGTEKLNTALIVTEGYGSIPMSEATYSLLKDNVGNAASINGATQIRAGVIRPEIVIPLENSNTDNDSESKMPEGIQEGSIVRVIRSPNFGKIGKVTSLPSELNKMESETMVRVAEINIDGSNFLIPRANLEMVEMDE